MKWLGKLKSLFIREHYQICVMRNGKGEIVSIVVSGEQGVILIHLGTVHECLGLTLPKDLSGGSLFFHYPEDCKTKL